MSRSPHHWKKTVLRETANLRDVIASLNQSSMQIVLIANADNKLLGTITDGDIRRALLRGDTINTLAANSMNTSPFTVSPDATPESVKNLMLNHMLRQIPVVNSNGEIRGLHVWDDLAISDRRPNHAVIMAGGFGKRLRPHTENCPKPMLPVRGKPMLEHIVEHLRGEGFSEITLSLHYLGHIIRDHFGDGAEWDVNLQYVEEEQPLGTAGALSLLDQDFAAPIVVTNGDLMTDIRYTELLDFHNDNKAMATMAIRVHEWQNPYGVVLTDGVEIREFEEKPIHRTNVNAGVYVLEPEALSHLGRNEHCDMPTLFKRLNAAGEKTVAYAMYEPWLDVGRPEDLERAANGEGS